jgi:hypothetical protein
MTASPAFHHRPGPTLARTVFEIGRASEYFDPGELAAQTGRPVNEFAAVMLKELVDNGLDAAETAGRAPAIAIAVTRDEDTLCLVVADNGPGLAPETLARILDFGTRTSDKSRYRSPTRGAQGNALKTVIGIPTALGSAAPVVVEACGLRHTIRPKLDAAGNVDVGHTVEDVPTGSGTRVIVTLPARGQRFVPQNWARAFALCNPHASVRIETRGGGIEHGHDTVAETGGFYRATVAFPGPWTKWLPSDPTSPWWYGAAALRALIDAEIAHGRQNGAGVKLVRDFVREFRGLSGTAKAKQVRAALPPHVLRLDDLDGGDVAALLAAMRGASMAAKPAALGLIGEGHVRACFDAWYRVVRDRFWYHKVAAMDGNIPFVVEAAVAETEVFGDLVSAVNFSPCYADPLRGEYFITDKAAGHGADGFLHACHVNRYPAQASTPWEPTFTAFVHVVCPALTFLDRGKSEIAARPALWSAVGTALWRVAKTAWEEGERRRKDLAAANRRTDALVRAWERADRAAKPTLLEAAFAVMEQAWGQATGDGAGPASARAIYYQARPLMQQLTDEAISDTYFTQTLLPRYQREVRDLPGVYYEPRGTLYEPHTGEAVPLGTREVEGYQIPPWTYDKILFVEKQGQWPRLQAAGLAERYDMAIIAGAGFATVAARVLLERAKADCTIFVLHDADPNGYNIAATLREETARMPEHRVEVIDIGLAIGEAEALGLQPETFTRRTALPKRLMLGEPERRAWKADRLASRARPVECVRVELDALSYPQLVAHIEGALERHGATAKVVPDEATIGTEARSRIRDKVEERLGELLDALVDRGLLAAVIADGIEPDGELLTPEAVRASLQANRPLSWRTYVGSMAGVAVMRADEAIARALHDAIADTRTADGTADGITDEEDEHGN